MTIAAAQEERDLDLMDATLHCPCGCPAFFIREEFIECIDCGRCKPHETVNRCFNA